VGAKRVSPGWRLARLALVVLLAVGFQIGAVSAVAVWGVTPEVPLVVAIAGGLALGSQRGAVLGFATGLALDVLVPARPLGLWALVLAVVGAATGWVGESGPGMPGRVARVATAVVATAGACVAYVALSGLVGSPVVTGVPLWRVVALASVWSAALVMPVEAVVRWAWEGRKQVAAWSR